MINKFQQGGSAQQGSVLQQIQQLPEEQQKQIMQAFAKWAQQKGVDLKQIQNNPQALEAALGQFIQELQQASQGQQTVAARHGAKLNYVKALKNQCPEGQEPYYYKKGGMVKCGCTGKKLMEDGGEIKKENAVARFKKTITNKKSNLKEGIKKGAKTIADSAVKIAKEKQWSDEHKRIMKASGIHNSPTQDYVAGDKCGGKVKKHQFGGTFLNNIINSAKQKLYGKNMEYTSNTKYFPNSNIRVTRKISPVNPYVQDTTYVAEMKVPNFEGVYNPIGLTSTYHGNNGDSPNILRLPYNNWKEMYEKSK